MTDLNIELLPWQQEVWTDDTRFKIVAAGRRTGKSRLAAWMLIVNALQADRGHVFYVAPTQGQARDIMWQTLLELGHPVIAGSHINNLQLKLVEGSAQIRQASCLRTRPTLGTSATHHALSLVCQHL